MKKIILPLISAAILSLLAHTAIANEFPDLIPLSSICTPPPPPQPGEPGYGEINALPGGIFWNPAFGIWMVLGLDGQYGEPAVIIATIEDYLATLTPPWAIFGQEPDGTWAFYGGEWNGVYHPTGYYYAWEIY